MTDILEKIAALENELKQSKVYATVETLALRLEPLTIGLRMHVPVIGRDQRMFRVRVMSQKPTSIHEVNAPPLTSLKRQIGRLNDYGQRILYLADQPETAFAEAGREAECFCLSEWCVQVDKLALANGGLTGRVLSQWSPESSAANNGFSGSENADEERVHRLFRNIFTLPVSHHNSAMYRWSIAAANAFGFSHLHERITTTESDGITHWEGRYPFAGIIYPSVRTSRSSFNFALNDFGMTKVALKNLQWVRRFDDGSTTSLNIATSWESDGSIKWLNRPAQMLLKSGEKARMTKIAETKWQYETGDGSIPWFT